MLQNEMKYPAAANVRDTTLTRSLYLDACWGGAMEVVAPERGEESGPAQALRAIRVYCEIRHEPHSVRRESPSHTHIMTVAEPKWANSALLLVLLTKEHVLTAT